MELEFRFRLCTIRNLCSGCQGGYPHPMTRAAANLIPVSGPALRPMRADARRNRRGILKAAREVFADHGHDAQIDDIARRAKVGVGTVYRHFPTKEALLEALVRERFAQIALSREALERADPWEAFSSSSGAARSCTPRTAGSPRPSPSAKTRSSRSADGRQLDDADAPRARPWGNARGRLELDDSIDDVRLGAVIARCRRGRVAPLPHDHARRAARRRSLVPAWPPLTSPIPSSRGSPGTWSRCSTAPATGGVDALLEEAQRARGRVRRAHAGKVAELDGAGLVDGDARARGDPGARRPRRLLRRAALLRPTPPTRSAARCCSACRSAARRSRRSCCSSSSSGRRSTTSAPRSCSPPTGWTSARHHLRTARRYRPHLLSEPEEKILTEKALTGRGAWTRLFEEQASAIDGRRCPATRAGRARVGARRLFSPDRDVRRSGRRGGHRGARARAAHARLHLQHAARRQDGRRPAAPLPALAREPQPRQRGVRRVGRRR